MLPGLLCSTSDLLLSIVVGPTIISLLHRQQKNLNHFGSEDSYFKIIIKNLMPFISKS